LAIIRPLHLERRKRRTSFLKKRSKKLLIPREFRDAASASIDPWAKEQKSFGSFLQKRTRFLSNALISPNFLLIGPLGIDVKGFLIAVHPVPEKISMVFR